MEIRQRVINVVMKFHAIVSRKDTEQGFIIGFFDEGTASRHEIKVEIRNHLFYGNLIKYSVDEELRGKVMPSTFFKLIEDKGIYVRR